MPPENLFADPEIELRKEFLADRADVNIEELAAISWMVASEEPWGCASCAACNLCPGCHSTVLKAVDHPAIVGDVTKLKKHSRHFTARHSDVSFHYMRAGIIAI
jgi:hypothetical protein